MDVFGMEERIPKAEQVAEVYVQGSYNRYIQGEERIKECIDLQKKIIASRREYQQYFKKYYGKKECNYMTVDIRYVMKNGKEQTWNYSLPIEEYYMEEDMALKELLRQESNPEDYMAYYFTEQYSNMELQSGSFLDWLDEEYSFQSREISVEEAEQLLEAFQKDLASGNYCIYPRTSREREEQTYVNTLTICYLPPKGAHLLQYGVEEEENTFNGSYAEYSGIILTKECKNTIAMLEEMGYIDEQHRLVTEEEYNAVFDEAMDDY